jgi:hypothetical protein
MNWIEASEPWRKAFSEGVPEEYRVTFGFGGSVNAGAAQAVPPPAIATGGGGA